MVAILESMEYQVPQFIEVEDKIIGPLTLRQFIYIAGTSGICVVAFIYLPIILAILVCVPIAAFGAALAFYRVNGKPFIEMLEAGFTYFTAPKLFLWRHENKASREEVAAARSAADEARLAAEHAQKAAPRLTRGKLTELAWSLDVQKPNPDELES
jgi:hypothetical protein